MSFIECIKSFLYDYLDKKIKNLKNKSLNDCYITLGTSDEVVIFRNILMKDSFDIDDINDLLLCYSDHLMDDYELLDFVTNNSYVYYEMDEACLSFDIRNLIIFYLLQSTDLNVVLGVFKLFSNKLVEFTYDNKNPSCNDLKIGNSLYDLYICYLDIVNETNLEIKKKKAISFMSLINISSIKECFKLFNITFDDIEEYVLNLEKDNKLNEVLIQRLLSNMLLLHNKELDNSEIIKKILLAYKEYSSINLSFKLDDFINYFNENYEIDYDCFYYNRQTKKIDIELLYYILTSNDNFSMYREYLGKFISLDYIKNKWQTKVDEFVFENKQACKERDEIVFNYFGVIERLKQPIDYTLNYYIYLNIPDNLRNSFYDVLKWYSANGYFERNIFLDSDECKKNTFKAILEECKNAIYEDFKRRKFIHKEYLTLVRKMISYKYITIKDWNEYLYQFAREYYVKEGLIHLSNMFKLLEKDLSLVEYQEENFDYSEFKYMCTSVKIAYPDMEESINLIYKKLNDELSRDIIISRNYIDELILARHSGIIRDFIDSDCVSRVHYLKVSGVSSLRFERAINVVRESNSELYEAYRNKVMNCLDRRSSLNGELSIKK